MAYKRKYVKRGRRRFYRKKASGGFGGMSVASAWKTAKWAAQQAWKLKGLVNSEMLKFDTNEAGSTVTSAGTYVSHLTAIAIGDTDNTRTGNSIYVRAVNLHGRVVYNATAGVTPTFLRLMIVIDSQQVGDTLPSIGHVIDTTVGGYQAHMLSTTVGRFKVLYSRIITNDSVQNTVKPFEINLPMRHHVRYNGSAGTDIQRGGIYVLAISSEAVNGPKLIWNARVSYHDN